MGSRNAKGKKTMNGPTRRGTELLLFASSFVAGCGWGSATVASSSGGSSSSNAQPVASALAAQRSATSPATIRFRLVDQEGNPTDVELRYRSGNPGSMFQPITLDPASNGLTGVRSDAPWTTRSCGTSRRTWATRASAVALAINTETFLGSIAAADLNADGAIDLVSMNESSDTLSIFFNLDCPSRLGFAKKQ